MGIYNKTIIILTLVTLQGCVTLFQVPPTTNNYSYHGVDGSPSIWEQHRIRSQNSINNVYRAYEASGLGKYPEIPYRPIQPKYELPRLRWDL